MLEKIADLPRGATCTHPEHKPPTHISLSDGVYRHTCPSCGTSQTFAVCNPRL